VVGNGRLIRLQLITWVPRAVCLSLDSLQIASDVADPTLIKDGLRCFQSGLRSTLTLFAENNYTVTCNKVTYAELNRVAVELHVCIQQVAASNLDKQDCRDLSWLFSGFLLGF